jgi:hypothetical protein
MNPIYINVEEDLQELIFEIQSISVEGEWALSFDRFIELLNIKKEIFYKELYILRRQKGEITNLKEFNSKNINFLSNLLDTLFKTDISDRILKKYGIYFTEADLNELEIYFKVFLENLLRKHKVDRELLFLLIGSTKSYDDAFDSYIDDKFDLELIINRSIENYLSDREIDSLSNAEIVLKKYLKEKLNSNKIVLKDITDEYKQRYYFEIYGRYYKGLTIMDIEKQKLLEYFELNENSKLSDLKKRFKELLMQYHPDKNKDGHEKTQEIIENYNRLFELIR